MAGSQERQIAGSRIVRALLIAAGSVLVAIGVLGIFLPLLPSTIFFLLAGLCYGKSSPAAYRWLTTNRLFGEQFRNYQEERGATIRTKIVALTTLWLGIAASAYIFHLPLWVDAILVVVATVVSIHLLMLRTVARAD